MRTIPSLVVVKTIIGAHNPPPYYSLETIIARPVLMTTTLVLARIKSSECIERIVILQHHAVACRSQQALVLVPCSMAGSCTIFRVNKPCTIACKAHSAHMNAASNAYIPPMIAHRAWSTDNLLTLACVMAWSIIPFLGYMRRQAC